MRTVESSVRRMVNDLAYLCGGSVHPQTARWRAAMAVEDSLIALDHYMAKPTFDAARDEARKLQREAAEKMP